MSLKTFSTNILIIILLISSFNYAQPKRNMTASEIKLSLNKLNTLGSVLYIAAHPDDENTAMLSYFSSGKLLRTGYLSLTRGDGGQNLIGSEQSEQLGIIRTQELIEARKRDGAEQFFTRAIDFGYSKSAEESFEIWGKEEILSDVVWVIRKFKPDVIITRFPTTGEGRHGHHTASAIIALEAFNLAGNPSVFPEQLNLVELWQPKRIYWNAWTPILQQRGEDISNLLKVNLGEFNSLLGMSYTEISALSRTMHKSQGFGDGGRREDVFNYFSLLDGDSVLNDPLDGIDLTWNRVSGGKEISNLILNAINNFNDENPSEILPTLLEIHSKISSLKNDYWKEVKLKELNELIRSCAGIWIECISKDYTVNHKQNISVTAGIVLRSNVEVNLKSVQVLGNSVKVDSFLTKGKMQKSEINFTVPTSSAITQPYWLVNENSGNIYNVKNQTHIGLAEKDPPFTAKFILDFNGYELELETPVYHKNIDPVDGELYRPLIVVPPATVNIEKEVYLFTDNLSKEIRLNVKSFTDKLEAILTLKINNGWRIEPKKIQVSVDKKYQEKLFTVQVFPPDDEKESVLQAQLELVGQTNNKSFVEINYPHFMPQVLFSDSKSKLVKLNIGQKKISKIGYIVGSGDKIPEYLVDLGFKVSLLSDDYISNNPLAEFDVIVTGIRAYNTRDRLSQNQKKILKYVEDGGSLIVQYNTRQELHAFPGPFPFDFSRERVTEENSEVEFLDVNHKILNSPNKLSHDDFNNWIQERGLYFASNYQDNYQDLLKMNDTGESIQNGSLIYTNYGKGFFSYTGLSFFRQIPAGVPGAIRLFINLISAGAND